MTDKSITCPNAGYPAVEQSTSDLTLEAQQTFSTAISMRRTWSASRTSGRFAVALRPILDPDHASARPKVRRRRQKRSGRSTRGC
jgi:hypothetical protein